MVVGGLATTETKTEQNWYDRVKKTEAESKEEGGREGERERDIYIERERLRER